ncbi:hypothetical protein [Streptomyces pseudovenezuelae]|uniref:Chaplin domain-containing protein n=1 Tax=Streptomyces pseudovenezuelae TaxID=67350 RepID=A0ABT6L9X5_9ACTN|nr:hypothetical protein [Streptomyces pseudovenezuelae]MDH6213087.1 hypothetical protein [Streptomyces pseudovenezuelae]
MSAGQALRHSLRSGRVRLALGATVAAAAFAVGGTLTAHADSAASAPQHKLKQVSVTDVCVDPDPNPDPDPVDAVPGGDDDLPKPDSTENIYYDGDDCAEPVPGDGDAVTAVPVPGDKYGTPHGPFREAKPAPAKH